MKKPNALILLLADLEAENNGTSAVTVEGSWARVSFPGETDTITFNAKECELLFDTPETAERLFDALDEPVDAVLTLHRLSLEGEVTDALREVFSSVDEG